MRRLVLLLICSLASQLHAYPSDHSKTTTEGYNSSEGYNLRYIYEIFNEEQRDKLKKIPNRELIQYEKINFKSQTGRISSVVYLMKYSNGKGFIGYCSAALISPKLALTAKHCMNAAELGLTVIVDDNYLMNQQPFQVSQVLRVEDKCSEIGWCSQEGSIDIPWKFENYKTRDFSGEDVVLLHLETAVQSKDGYFKIHNAKKDLSAIKLSVAGLPSFAVSSTGSYNNKYISEPVCDYLLTIGTTLITNCLPASGISGGPIFYTESGVNYLVGIVSSSIGPVFTGPDKSEFFGGTRAAAISEIEFIKNLDLPK